MVIFIKQEELGALIYRDWKVHANKSALKRSGFLLVGACDNNLDASVGKSGAEMSLQRDPGRPNSVAEHSDGLAHLAFAVSMWKPDLISASELRRVLKVLAYHDAPETIAGDVPDDGERDDALKDRLEYEALLEMTAHWPKKYRDELRSDYLKFQNHETRLFQVAYCLDKVEAVLRMLEYERAGRTGSIANKPHISAQDRRFAEEIGTYLAADGWARHVLERVKDCAGHNLAFWIMAAAFRDVRGAMPEWMTDFI